jgi:hypothetical protein
MATARISVRDKMMAARDHTVQRADWLAILERVAACHPRLVRVGDVFVLAPVRHFIRLMEVASVAFRDGVGPAVRFRPLFDDPNELSRGAGSPFWSPALGDLDHDATRRDAADQAAAMFDERMFGYLDAIEDVESYLLACLEGCGFSEFEDRAIILVAAGHSDFVYDRLSNSLASARQALPNHTKQGWDTASIERKIALYEPLVEAIPKGPVAVQAVLHANEREAARRFGIEHLYEQVPFAKLS